MIYFSLPNLYNHVFLIKKIFSFNTKTKDILKYPIHFITVEESLPFCYLSGGVNINQNFILTQPELQDTIKYNGITKRLNFSNLYINENDLKDEYFNLLLNTYNNNSNWIEISNLPTAINLKNQNIPFDLIFSNNADILFPFSTDVINTIIEQNIFKLISLPAYINLNTFNLKEIVHKKYLELTINNPCGNCPISCQQDCIKNEHNSIYNYSNHSQYNNCTNFIPYNNIKTINISLEDIQQKYLPLGITHYKLNNLPNTTNAFINFIFFFVNYFIKEEYQQEILIELLKENNKQ